MVPAKAGAGCGAKARDWSARRGGGEAAARQSALRKAAGFPANNAKWCICQGEFVHRRRWRRAPRSSLAPSLAHSRRPKVVGRQRRVWRSFHPRHHQDTLIANRLLQYRAAKKIEDLIEDNKEERKTVSSATPGRTSQFGRHSRVGGIFVRLYRLYVLSTSTCSNMNGMLRKLYL